MRRDTASQLKSNAQPVTLRTRHPSPRRAALDGNPLTVVVDDDLDEAVGEVIDRVELAVAQQAPLQDREEQFDLVQPAGVRRGVVQEEVRPILEERFDSGGEVGRQVVDDAMQLH
jgi:hypothetical protein